MTLKTAQVRTLMRERAKGKTQEQAAAKADVKSRQTVAKYEKQQGQRVEPLPRQYQTRANPFAADWESIEQLLNQEPHLEAKTIWAWLEEQHPGRYQEGQLRTLQRHIARWRGLHQNQVAVLEQIHQPGEVLQTDGVWLNSLNITIQQAPFPHLLIHSVLPYSNWEWGHIAHSESLAAIQAGLESTLQKLGAIPQAHQTDHSTAATHTLGANEQELSGARRGYNASYLLLLEHYGLEPRTTHVRRPQENGDVEASNGGLRRGLEQQLLLRGNRDFASVPDYEAWLVKMFNRRNQPRQARLREELAVMRTLQVAPVGSLRQFRVRVTRGSLIRVEGKVYSVPTSLIGHEVLVQQREWELQVYYSGRRMVTIPRLEGQPPQHQINYHHVVESLLRKPGGFRNYLYREDLFPRLVFRQAWEALQKWMAPRKADLSYLRILHLAAQALESEVATILTGLLQTETPWDDTDVARLAQPPMPAIPALTANPVDLTIYDRLLREVTHVPA